jgi:cytoskeletal protein CcmA (bactofilin family)
MWSNKTPNEAAQSPAQPAAPNVTPFHSASAPSRPVGSSRSYARLGASLQIKGEISGSENVELDCIVDGPIYLDGHELIVGSTAQLRSEIHAGEVVVNGKIVGNVHARGRVEITKDGSITGDIGCARISIEDGAHFKGRIEIDPAKSKIAAD